MNETDIINDYKNTVKRLQQECTEKTDAIIVLDNQLHRYKQAIEDIKEAVKYDVYTTRTELCIKLNRAKKIIKKCEEVNE